MNDPGAPGYDRAIIKRSRLPRAAVLGLAVGGVCGGLQAPGAAEQNTVPSDLSGVDAVVQAAIDRGEVPGAVLVVGNAQGILYRKAYGNRALKPDTIPMTPDTVFDLASLTKPTATATSIMLLIERGQLNLSDKI